ncbi:hypothetical protein J6590_017298 [Homalodisca vitripennis]|nr:hypothetical protein J6590_017298 [Homalodisca vitripennis]
MDSPGPRLVADSGHRHMSHLMLPPQEKAVNDATSNGIVNDYDDTKDTALAGKAANPLVKVPPREGPLSCRSGSSVVLGNSRDPQRASSNRSSEEIETSLGRKAPPCLLHNLNTPPLPLHAPSRTASSRSSRLGFLHSLGHLQHMQHTSPQLLYRLLLRATSCSDFYL